MSDIDVLAIDDPGLSSFAPLAAEFCGLVDAHATLDADAMIQRVHGLLPGLYAAGLRLPPTTVLFLDDDATPADDDVVEVSTEPDPDAWTHEEWRRLYDALTEKFGAANYYREIFDPYDHASEEEVTGSVADDIADIYRDLRRGLRKWQRGETGPALWEWRFHFEHHWGEHLTGALRALHAWIERQDAWPDRR